MTGERVAPATLDRLSFAARAEAYARAAVAGEVLVGKWVKAACQRHLDDLARCASDPDWPFEFDAQKCGRLCHFLELLPHVKGEWARPKVVDGALVRPRIRLEDWQVFCHGVPFGWVYRKTRRRRFRRSYQEVARKNAKTTPAAGVALYLLACDDELGGEVYSLATKRDQAKIVWDIGAQMLMAEPELRSRPPFGPGIGANSRAIFRQDIGSKWEPLGRDSDTKDGFNTHAFIGDELHAWKDRQLYDVMDSSTGARAQPMGWMITTAGHNLVGI